jgi:hypothetical protein
VSIEKLNAKALRLDPGTCANPARASLASADGMGDAEIERLWLDQTMARDHAALVRRLQDALDGPSSGAT